MQIFPETESTILLPGPAGHIEVLTTPVNATHPKQATAIICHPHPLFGGTMNNKVITTLAKTFQTLGLRTVRFNFRGVGKSTGTHDEGRGETEDVLVLMNWIKTLFPQEEIWLAGFSFGAIVAMRAAMQNNPARLITIAPPVIRFELNDVTKIKCPWWLVQGEQDDVVLASDVYTWYDTLDPKPHLIRMPMAGHFFHGLLLELREALERALSV